MTKVVLWFKKNLDFHKFNVIFLCKNQTYDWPNFIIIFPPYLLQLGRSDR